MARLPTRWTRGLQFLMIVGLAACSDPTGASKAADGSQQSLIQPRGVVTVSPKTSALLPGGTVQLAATVTGLSTTAVMWTSSNASVATVSSTGLVTATGVGTASIVAKLQANGDKHGESAITVRR